VTGFGLLGHGLEMARASAVTLHIAAAAVPFFARARALTEEGFVTGASHRNWDSYGAGVVLPDGNAPTLRYLLTDPQTSGGLLVACAPEAADALLTHIRTAGYPAAAIIGTVADGPARIEVGA
jgi:selenide,water dikinase